MLIALHVISANYICVIAPYSRRKIFSNPIAKNKFIYYEKKTNVITILCTLH